MSTIQSFKKSKQDLIKCFQSLKVLQDSLFESIDLTICKQWQDATTPEDNDQFNSNADKLAAVFQHNQEVMDNLKDLLDNL